MRLIKNNRENRVGFRHPESGRLGKTRCFGCVEITVFPHSGTQRIRGPYFSVQKVSWPGVKNSSDLWFRGAGPRTLGFRSTAGLPVQLVIYVLRVSIQRSNVKQSNKAHQCNAKLCKQCTAKQRKCNAVQSSTNQMQCNAIRSKSQQSKAMQN